MNNTSSTNNTNGKKFSTRLWSEFTGVARDKARDFVMSHRPGVLIIEHKNDPDKNNESEYIVRHLREACNDPTQPFTVITVIPNEFERMSFT